MISVSIIIPVYGVEQHIERCLRSVFRQNFDGELECILIDDATPDNSMRIIDELLCSYTGNIQFHILHHKQNRGLSATRNTGTKAAKGDYLFYLDSDDEIMPHAISTLVALVEKYPEVDIVYGDWYVSRKYIFLQNEESLPEYSNNPKEIASFILDNKVAVTAPNKLLRKKFIWDNALFFKENILHEDELFNYFLAESAMAIAISHVPTYVYYLNPNGIMGDGNKERKIHSLIELTGDVLKKGNRLYRFVFCERFLRNISSHITNASQDYSDYKKLAQKVYTSACNNHLYLYAIYIYGFYRLPIKWLEYAYNQRLIAKLYRYIKCDIWKKTKIV